MVAGWAGIPELSTCVGCCSAAWLQSRLQSRGRGADPRPSAIQAWHRPSRREMCERARGVAGRWCWPLTAGVAVIVAVSHQAGQAYGSRTLEWAGGVRAVFSALVYGVLHDECEPIPDRQRSIRCHAAVVGIGHSGAVRLEPGGRTVAIGLAAVALALVLGAVAGTLAGAGAGALAALASLIPAAVLAVAVELRRRNVARMKRQQEVLRRFAPPKSTSDREGEE